MEVAVRIPTKIEIPINPHGTCVLLSLREITHEDDWTYTKLHEHASLMYDLGELPYLTDNEIQEITRIVAITFSKYDLEADQAVSVWISGRHLAFPDIDVSGENQLKEVCVNSIELFFPSLDDASSYTARKVRTVKVSYEKRGAADLEILEGEDNVYGLFLINEE